ncbi:MAG: SOS response-associated peptidase family protein [Candidatus Cyclobacteriaceae bacterium M3_2C_046]
MIQGYTIATKPRAFGKLLNATLDYEYQPVYHAYYDKILPVTTNQQPTLIEGYPWGSRIYPNSKPYYAIRVENMLQHWKLSKKVKVPLLQMIRQNRCLVWANCFFIWSEQVPYLIYVQDQRLFAMAGIWQQWKAPQNQLWYGFSILLQPPNHLMSTFNQNFMPLVLEEYEQKIWLKNSTSYQKIIGIMNKKYASEKMNGFQIRPLIRNRSLNNANILQPVSQRVQPEVYHQVKEKLVPLGWGRSKPQTDQEPLWKQMGLNPPANQEMNS